VRSHRNPLWQLGTGLFRHPAAFRGWSGSCGDVAGDLCRPGRYSDRFIQKGYMRFDPFAVNQPADGLGAAIGAVPDEAFGI